MISAKNFNWKKNILYLGTEKTGFSVEYAGGPEEYYNCFKVKYPDGNLSEDFYNLTRTKDHCISQASLHFNSDEKGT